MELFFNYSGVSRQFDVGAMAKLSDGYTVGSIIESVKEVSSSSCKSPSAKTNNKINILHRLCLAKEFFNLSYNL